LRERATRRDTGGRRTVVPQGDARPRTARFRFARRAGVSDLLRQTPAWDETQSSAPPPNSRSLSRGGASVSAHHLRGRTCEPDHLGSTMGCLCRQRTLYPFCTHRT
jgi:hypothetical protein